MPTVQSRKLRRRAAVSNEYGAPRRTRRRSWLPLGMFGGLLALVWFAPSIVAHTSLRDQILSSVADVDGRITSSGASFGWLSSISIRDIEVLDKRGDRVLLVPELQGNRALWRMLTQRSQLGRVRLVKPDVRIVITDDGTNVEDVLQHWLADQSASGDKSVEVEIVGGRVSVIDKQVPGEWLLTGCDATLALPSGPTGDIACRAKGIAGEGTASGQFDIACEIPSAQAGKTRLAKATVKTTNFPLALAGGALRHYSAGAELDGRMTAELAGHWNLATDSPRDMLLEGIVKTTDLQAAGTWLGDDKLKLAQAEAPCRISWQAETLKVEKLNVACDLGTAKIAGTVDTSKNWLSSIWSQSYDVKGEVKLAELSRALPHLVRLRDDTTITGGVVNVALTSKPAGKGLEWLGKIDSTQLVAQRDGKQIGWDHPVHVAFAAHDSAAGTIIDRLYCEADFLELEGSGTPEAGQISGSYNLDRLSAELGKFVNIGDLKLAGSGWVHSTWKQDAQGRWDADAELQVLDFALARPGRPAWSERKLELTLAVAGDLADSRVQRVNAAQMQLTAGGDKLSMRLLGPVAEFSETGLWPLELKLQGAVAKWQPRLDPWFDFPEGWDLAGDCDVTARATWSPQSLSIEQLTANLRRLRGWGHGWFIDEPQAQLTAAAFWSSDRQRLEIREAELKSSAVSIQADDIVLAWTEDGEADVRGLARYSGDLARLNRWMQDPAQPIEHEVSGTFDGEAVVSRTGTTTEARWQSTARNVSVGAAGKQPWKEPQIRLAGRGRHDRRADKITLTSFELGSDALSLSAGGEINDLAKRRNLELNGNLRYDLAKLEPLWQRLLGSDLKVTGAESRAFSFRGPLSAPEQPAAPKNTLDKVVTVDRQRRPNDGFAVHYVTPAVTPPAVAESWLRQITGQAGVGWQSIEVYGLGLGRGNADATLADGLLKVAPISVTASGGRVNLTPTVRLTPSPMQLTLAPGKAAEQIQITPQMCDQALKYIAPILAGVTQAQGAFSVQLDGAAIPLTEPKRADIAGKMIVHSVEVGPGPLVQELAILFNRAAPARLQRESVVDFRMVEGRIYHRGLELVFPDLTIRTYGSVGLDQTLSMVAEMSVPPKWIGNNRLGDALKNQTIRLPLGGTLSKPKIDQAAMQQASAQFVRNAAGTAIEGEVQRQIDRQFQRLFGPTP